jgi:hypothetical protein
MGVKGWDGIESILVSCAWKKEKEKRKNKKIKNTPVSKYRREFEPVSLRLIMVSHDAT